MSDPLDFDTAETFGFDATGRDGDPRHPQTAADAIDKLGERVDALIELGALVTHDAQLPYTFEIVAATSNPALARVLMHRFPDVVEDLGDTVGVPETRLNIDSDTGQIDRSLPLDDAHVSLADLLTVIEAISCP